MHTICLESTEKRFRANVTALAEIHDTLAASAPLHYKVHFESPNHRRVFETDSISALPDVLCFTDSTNEPIVALWEYITKIVVRWEGAWLDDVPTWMVVRSRYR
jgi:hypothetical protein